MLKKISASLWLLCFVSAAYAQEDDKKADETEESKRPSWSAGMPERQKSAGLKKPAFKPERDNEIELDMSEFGLKQKPEIEMELPINTGIAGMPVAKPNSEKSAAEQAAAELAAAELAAAEQAAAEQAAAEQAAAEQAAAEQAAAEQAAAEQAAAEQAAAEQAAAEQAAAEQAAAEQAAAEQAAAEQAAAEQAAAEQAAAEQVAAEQAVLDQATSQPANSVENSTQVVQETIILPEERNIASVEPPVTNEPANINQSASDQLEYSWNILKRSPVNYPVKAAIENLEGWVEVEITINPAGEVVSASPKEYSRRGRVFGKPAVQSVKNWMFEPPSNMGITTNLTRVYKVEFDL